MDSVRHPFKPTHFASIPRSLGTLEPYEDNGIAREFSHEVVDILEPAIAILASAWGFVGRRYSSAT